MICFFFCGQYLELTCTIAKSDSICFDASCNPLSNNKKSDILTTKVVTLDAHDHIAKHLRDAMLNLSPKNAFFSSHDITTWPVFSKSMIEKAEFAHFEIC